jgi:hypothetical protein
MKKYYVKKSLQGLADKPGSRIAYRSLFLLLSLPFLNPEELTLSHDAKES